MEGSLARSRNNKGVMDARECLRGERGQEGEGVCQRVEEDGRGEGERECGGEELS